MAICLCCGKEYDGCLCGECAAKTDIEDLCNRIIAYNPDNGEEPRADQIWEKAAAEMTYPSNFKNVAFSVADFLPSPKREWQKIHSIVGDSVRVPRASKEWFYQVYDKIIGSEKLGKTERIRLKGLMLETLYQDYRYREADELALDLLDRPLNVWQAAYVIAEFFCQTRRYDEAEDAMSVGRTLAVDNKDAIRTFDDLLAKHEKRRAAADAEKKGEYLPNPKEGKAEAIEKYREFMSSIGIDVDISSTKSSGGGRYPEPIPKGEYPELIETRDPSFDSFVAFDLETTGIHPATDSIIEIGAVRVVNGEIRESEEFIFREFVKPFKRSVTDFVTELTGITREDVKDARQMWEVVPDFMEFVGDDVLVGFNSVNFDGQFIQRAGRYSNQIYTNRHFDVWRYAKELKEIIGYTGEDFKLGTVGEFLGIKNPEAHRALADAITTARIFLKLKELSAGQTSVLCDGGVLDLEDW
ncbi:exonuclease domain-containing protein [[Clostridium] aminophilum]|uniref:DNA polymerase-3 subunit alpha n=1 Tax=[Clostridium] aminophilum TaxID=1526 RepID=A0A1I6KH69_9FIRM|nr:exonuclease domain-containing protein [[Clostridium] aminophilum]SFR90388.1 DNA polymerase-3 subunit alpha [[Clostridium] aminophilum]